jgi:hypothetical protein
LNVANYHAATLRERTLSEREEENFLRQCAANIFVGCLFCFVGRMPTARFFLHLLLRFELRKFRAGNFTA